MSIDSKSFFSSPLFEPLLPMLAQFGPLDKPPSIEVLNQILDVDNLKFVPQKAQWDNFEDAYEPRIFLKQEVQTRDHSWHDFFNALVWKRFLKSKRIINRLHFNLQKSRHPSKNRLPAENMLTLFDENGAIVIAKSDYFLNLIRQHRWHELFWQNREILSDQVEVIIFGHGLYEKALCPYIGITAQCLMFVADDSSLSSVDALVAEYLDENNYELKPSLLAPLPILGLPGWWEQNNDEQFYENKNYFRPAAATSFSFHLNA